MNARAKRIERIAALLFGTNHANPGSAAPGWQTRLSRAMGMNAGAVNATLSLANGEVFDRKLGPWLYDAEESMLARLNELGALQTEIVEEQIGEMPRATAWGRLSVFGSTECLLPLIDAGWTVTTCLDDPEHNDVFIRVDKSGGGPAIIFRSTDRVRVHVDDDRTEFTGDGALVRAVAFALAVDKEPV